MPVPERLNRYIETEKQRHFSRDFLVGWGNYETWEEATVGQSGPAQRVFEISEEDILSYNRACGETDPLMVAPEYARKHSPTGELLQHPIFVTAIAFYSLGEKGIGTWIRTPGALWLAILGAGIAAGVLAESVYDRKRDLGVRLWPGSIGDFGSVGGRHNPLRSDRPLSHRGGRGRGES